MPNVSPVSNEDQQGVRASRFCRDSAKIRLDTGVCGLKKKKKKKKKEKEGEGKEDVLSSQHQNRYMSMIRISQVAASEALILSKYCQFACYRISGILA
jgi:hypothetical protein